MINFDIIIYSLSIAVSLYFVFNNIVKRFFYSENILFSIACLSWSAMLFIKIYQTIYAVKSGIFFLDRYYFGFFLIVCQCILSIILLFPGWEKRPRILFIILSQVPASLLLCLALFTDYIISNKGFYGNSQYLYASISGIYIIAVFTISFLRSRHFEDKVFKLQVLPFQLGMLFAAIILMTSYIILPFYFKIDEYKSPGLMGAFFLQIILNYSLSDKRQKDFKKLYLNSAFWALIIAVITISAFLFVKEAFDSNYTAGDPRLFAGALIISLVSALLYGILRLLTQKIRKIKNKELSEIFNKISYNISELSHMKKQKMDWNIFFQKAIVASFEMLKIEKISFFLLNEDSRVYELKHSSEENMQIAELRDGSDIITALMQYKQIIEKSFLYQYKELERYKGTLIGFFNHNDLVAALPLFSHSNKLIGVLFLGKLSGETAYPFDYISFLDIYRVQFSTLLENLISSEEIRKTQVAKRDRMMVKNIKRSIIPDKFKNIEGLKVSSLYVNNSDSGGDFFDSVKIRENKLGIFAANTSYAGIESALLALQMNSVFNSQAYTHDTPESLLNVINKVVCTSRFTEKYATAFYMIYDNSSREILFSNAAFNSLILFDPKNEIFAEFDSDGIPIGVDIGFQYQHRTLLAPSNAIGVFYSQGVISAINKTGNNYPVSQIKDIIRIYKAESPAMLVRKIYDDFNKFVNYVMPSDITLIIFKAD